MLSLRSFHLFFVLVSIVGADVFGIWAILRYVRTGEALMLTLGVASVLGGLGLIVYVVRLVRAFDTAGIH